MKSLGLEPTQKKKKVLTFSIFLVGFFYCEGQPSATLPQFCIRNISNTLVSILVDSI